MKIFFVKKHQITIFMIFSCFYFSKLSAFFVSIHRSMLISEIMSFDKKKTQIKRKTLKNLLFLFGKRVLNYAGIRKIEF